MNLFKETHIRINLKWFVVIFNHFWLLVCEEMRIIATNSVILNNYVYLI